MKRSSAVHLTLVASVASFLVSCEQRATRYCVDESQNAADDRNCEHSDARYHWYYAHGYNAVRNGMHVGNGSAVPPPGGYAVRSQGEGEGEGSVRGGIGGAGEAASGHGGGGEGGGE